MSSSFFMISPLRLLHPPFPGHVSSSKPSAFGQIKSRSRFKWPPLRIWPQSRPFRFGPPPASGRQTGFPAADCRGRIFIDRGNLLANVPTPYAAVIFLRPARLFQEALCQLRDRACPSKQALENTGSCATVSPCSRWWRLFSFATAWHGWPAAACLLI